MEQMKEFKSINLDKIANLCEWNKTNRDLWKEKFFYFVQLEKENALNNFQKIPRLDKDLVQDRIWGKEEGN
jgi:hypothetical protein